MTNTNLITKEQTTRENRFWVRITAACNEKCLFCLDADAQNGKLIADDIVREKIRSGYQPGTYNRIIISGGEASINPKFADYIRYAREIGYDRIQTVTNGNMFFRPEFCKKVFDAWLQEVTISLHGHTRELHDYLTATPWSFDKAIRGLIHIRKYYPHIIINIDIVVNKINVDFLPQIVKFFMRLGVYEYDILQIIPFGRGFAEYKDILFYQIEDHLRALHDTWQLSRTPGMHMWTNRFPAEAFEWYEDLIQDPRKIKWETMAEAYTMYDDFIRSDGAKKPVCFGASCEVCFLRQYCHDYLGHKDTRLPDWEKYIIDGQSIPSDVADYVVLRGEEFPSDVYAKYGKDARDFTHYIAHMPLWDHQKVVNIPKCLRSDHNDSLYEWYGDTQSTKNVAEYTKDYTMNFYRKKSVRCKACKYSDTCEWIHINFIRSYGFQILQPITV